MISIIICSRNPSISDDLQGNIDATIGSEYELIVIDNSQNKYSIFEAYNLGIERSNGAYLCFIHDDILFHTQGWGEVVNQIFEADNSVGLIGVAGAKIKTKMPSAWWDCVEGDKLLYLRQHLRNGIVEDWDKGFTDKNMERVVAIDGLFMVARRDERFRFQEPFKGFHGYDLNISFEYIQLGYEILVSNLILVEHFSLGTLNKDWYSSNLKMHKLYFNLLPLKEEKRIVTKEIEFANGVNFIKGLLFFKFKKEAFVLWLQLIIIKPISRYHVKFLKQML
jgi:glycosyltransferase involved in cell wall biosynthesis